MRPTFFTRNTDSSDQSPLEFDTVTRSGFTADYRGFRVVTIDDLVNPHLPDGRSTELRHPFRTGSHSAVTNDIELLASDRPIIAANTGDDGLAVSFKHLASHEHAVDD